MYDLNQPVLLLHDGMTLDRQELLVHVRSGNYLVTLATLLDAISDTLTVENEAEGVILQQLVGNLIYLDDHYKLVEKTT